MTGLRAMAPVLAAGLMLFGALQPCRAAVRPVRDGVQEQLDAMTRADLCARDDADLRRLNRSLGATASPKKRAAAAR